MRRMITDVSAAAAVLGFAWMMMVWSSAVAG